MRESRRQLLLAAVAAAATSCSKQPEPASTAGAPPTFNTAPEAGPPVAAGTFAEAEKLVQITMTPAHRQLAAENWRRSMAPILERRIGPRKVTLEPAVAPASVWNPLSAAGKQPAREQM